MHSESSASDATLAAGPSLRLLAYPLFFASGMAGLVYEIVWTRMLIYVFGAGIYAVTAVLAAFMAGLALGSYVLGRYADRLRNPIRFYGVLELLIAAAGLILPFFLRRIDIVDGWSYARWGQSFAIMSAWRFVVTFALLLIPTTLMGATLPVLTKAMVRDSGRLGRHIGGLYAINTAGAVAGAFAAGFFFIERFGVYQTEIIAALLNLVAAAGAIALSFGVRDAAPIEAGLGKPTPSIQRQPLVRSQVRLILFAAFATGVISLGSQVVWFRSLVFAFEYLKNTTYAFSAMLTIFLLGLAIGSALVGMFIDRQANPMRFYGILLVLLGLSMAVSVGMLRSGAQIAIIAEPFRQIDETGGDQEFLWPIAVVNIMMQTVAVLGVPTLLMGMALPVAARAVVSVELIGSETGRLYALNTCGAIVGSVLAAFVIIPLLGLGRGLYFLAIADAILGLVVLARAPFSRSMAYVSAPTVIVLFALIMFGQGGGATLQQVNPGEQIVYYDEGPLATVSVVRNNVGHDTIYVDGVGVAGTDPMLQTDQKSLAHLPALIAENPRSALTVGFGSGGASYSYLLHPDLEQVHCVEICDEVVAAAPYLKAANHGFLERENPRYKIIYDDARTYLQYTEQMYDIIATDCTDLRYKSSANLYDLEYFTFCRQRLRPGGMVVVWMPLGGLSDHMFRVALRTFHRVFPEMGVFFMNNEPTHYILLLGWRDEMKIDFRLIEERLRNQYVRADLAELHLDDPVKILSTFITGGDQLSEYLAGDTLNTENEPVIEFGSPKYGYEDQPVIDNLASLMDRRASILDWIEPESISEQTRARLERFEEAMPVINDAHAAYRKLDIPRAAELYKQAQDIAPSDKSLANLLEFPELRVLAGQGSLWARLMIGRTQAVRGMTDEARREYNYVIEQLSALERQGRLGPQQQFVIQNARAWLGEL